MKSALLSSKLSIMISVTGYYGIFSGHFLVDAPLLTIGRQSGRPIRQSHGPDNQGTVADRLWLR